MSPYRIPAVALIVTLMFAASASADDKAQAPTWLAPGVEAMPDLPLGPFVALDDGGLLTIDGTDALISRDDGATWQRRPIFEDPDAYEIRPERALIRTRAGTIILAFVNNKERRWGWDTSVSDAPGATLPTYTVRSLDNGKTWQPPQKLHDAWTGAIRDIIQTRDGHVVFTSMMMLHDPGRHASVTYTSDDEGQTWRRSNLIDLGGQGHHDGALEPSLTQLRDGRLWMLIRTNFDRFWSAYSSDNGLSWRVLEPSPIDAGSAPGLVQRLESGRLVLVWNRLYPEGKQDHPRVGGDGQWSREPAINHRAELAIAFSEDEGTTWSKPVVIARRADGKWLAYPYVHEHRPGELWITTMQGDLRVRLNESDFVAEEPADFHAAARARPTRVACVGDSITFGAGIPDREQSSYPAQLARLLGEGWVVRNFGHNGTTALKASGRPYWTQEVFAQATAFNPDMVVLMLGTNDAHPPTWSAHGAAFAEDYAALAEHFQALPSRPQVWLCAPVPLMPGRDDARMRNLAQRIVPLIHQVAEARGLPVIDLHTPRFNRPELYVDKVHPTAEGARLIAQQVSGVLSAAQRSR